MGYIKRMKYVFALLAFLCVGSLGLICPSYVEEKGPMSTEGCAIKVMEESTIRVSIQACPEKKYCRVPKGYDEEGTCFTQLPVSGPYPGDYCTANSTCLSKNCVQNRCVGTPEGQPCKTHSDCNGGLYCNTTNYCAPTIKENGSCDDSKKCDAAAFCSNNTCERYGSLEEEKFAAIPSLCKSFYSVGGKCKSGPKLQGNTTCPETQKCQYKSKDEPAFTESCVCGYSKSGTPYCNQGRGDNDIADYAAYMKQEAAQLCHILSGPMCLSKKFSEMPSEYFKALVAFTKVTQSAALIDDQAYIKATFMRNYYDALDKVNSSDTDKFGLYLFLGIAIGAVLVIAILLLVIYFKKSKSEDDEAGETTKEKYTAAPQAIHSLPLFHQPRDYRKNVLTILSS
eukprot:TRINITY_DN119_c0_g1_i1.p1 TRINITY_DN119_c0_g1~~TRINITY_DN119_c0_g1_i1.p1  ORF type:complete len:429 (-),score=79.43 TRINITY_DN119_c0_g1_i1:6-1193(-)